MRKLVAGLVLAAALFGAAARAVAAGNDKVIEVRKGEVAINQSLDALFAEFDRRDRAGDADGAAKVLSDVMRLRMERNIGGIEPMAMALVAKGIDRVRKGERDAAELYFRGALGLDPRLPDAYLGMAQAQIRKGPFGIISALKQTFVAITAGSKTSYGRYRLLSLLIPAILVALLATASAFAFALLVRFGTLLLHDLEEELGPTRGVTFARGVFLLLLLLPLVLFEGYGWLPLWWMAILFAYLGLFERVAVLLLLVASLLVGPLANSLDAEARAQRNPLYRAAVMVVEGGPDPLATLELEKAQAAYADDRDLQYLLARQYRKGGRDEDAANLYREILKKDAKDAVALNNLANIEFYRTEFSPAIARYKQGTELAAGPVFTATFYYNLAQAHLQRFEFQPATEARAQADRLSADLTKGYETAWKYEKGGNAVAAVVDLGLTKDQVAAKFAGVSQGVGLKNVAGRNVAGEGLAPGAFLNRFLVFAGVFAFVSVFIWRRRGNRLVTLRCLKCGNAFRRRVTAQDTGELCTQCFHLFVVRDGVSPSAKNKKLMEVQAEDDRRSRTFRLLSLLLPGAGHVFGRQPIPGLLLLLTWFGVLSLVALAGRPFSVTGSSSALLGSWIFAPAALLLLVIYFVANRFRPSFDVMLPVRRAPARRG